MTGTQKLLRDFEDVDVASADLDELTDAEREVYEATVDGDHDVREYARKTNRVPGTVGNLLRRARDKLEGEEQ